MTRPSLDEVQAYRAHVDAAMAEFFGHAEPDAWRVAGPLVELGLPAESVLHVGDSSADVSGASRAGMRTAWVNRHGRRLPESCPRPDWEIVDLSAVPQILEQAQ